MIIKWTVYTMIPLGNSLFTSIQGNYFSFRFQSGVLQWIDTPLTRSQQTSRVCHPFRKYSHSMDHVPISNKTLFLRPLIMNILSTTVPSLLSQAACPFQKRSTNRVWSSKWSRFIAWRLGGTDSSIHMELFCVRMGVCGLGPIIFVLLSMAKDKNIHHN